MEKYRRTHRKCIFYLVTLTMLIGVASCSPCPGAIIEEGGNSTDSGAVMLAIAKGVFPAKNVYMSVNKSLIITCNCERIKDCDSKYMYIKERKGYNETCVPITILDSKRVQYKEAAVTLNKDGTRFHCYMWNASNPTNTTEKEYIGSSPEVHVGELELATELECVFNNWDEAVCKWCEDNKSTTGTWTVQYRTGTNGKWVLCPNLTTCTCTWDDDYVRQNDVTVNISFSNEFGFTEETFEVDFSDITLIRPTLVENFLKVIPVDSRTTNVTYKETTHTLAAVALVFNITMQSKFETKSKVYNSPNGSSHDVREVFDDLLPFTTYTASVKVIPKGGRYWSEPITESGRTLADVPARNPETRPSSFQYQLCGDDCRTLTVYYKDIPERYTQGIIEDMSATFRDGRGRNYYTSCSFAEDRKCELKDVPLTSDFSILIVGSTDVGSGPSVPTSEMRILEYHKGSNVPEHLVGEIQEDINDTTAVILYEWIYDGETPDAFVLYYRHKIKDVVQGGMSWFVLNGTQNRAELVLEHDGSGFSQDYQFAVAAEKSAQSAGMSKSFLTCLFKRGGEDPVIQAFDFDAKNQGRGSLKMVLPPQECKPEHKQIVNIMINVLEVTADGAVKKGGKNQTETIPALRVPQPYIATNLKDSAFYNISLTAVCRDGSNCQYLPGVKLETNPPLPYVFPAWAIAVISIILALVILFSGGIDWYYRRTTSRARQLPIQRTPAVAQAERLEESGATDEYYDATIDYTPRGERSESESSISDGDHGTTELIPNKKQGRGSGYLATSFPGKSASDEVSSSGPPSHLNPMSHQPSLQPVTEVEEDTINSYLNGDVFLDVTDERGHYVANNQQFGPNVDSPSQTTPAQILTIPPVLNLETLDNPHVLHLETHDENKSNEKVIKKDSLSSEGSASGEYDEYVKVTTLQHGVDPGETKSERNLVPKTKTKSSPGNSPLGKETQYVLPSQLEFPASRPLSDSDSDDDSSTTSDKTFGELPSSLQGMPISGGYMQRPDRCPADAAPFLQNTFQIKVT